MHIHTIDCGTAKCENYAKCEKINAKCEKINAKCEKVSTLNVKCLREMWKRQSAHNDIYDIYSDIVTVTT